MSTYVNAHVFLNPLIFIIHDLLSPTSPRICISKKYVCLCSLEIQCINKYIIIKRYSCSCIQSWLYNHCIMLVMIYVVIVYSFQIFLIKPALYCCLFHGASMSLMFLKAIFMSCVFQLILEFWPLYLFLSLILSSVLSASLQFSSSLAEILQREVWCLWLFRNKTLEIGWRLIFCRSLTGWVKSKIKLNSSITGLSIVCAPHILVTCSYKLYSYTVAWTQLSVHWLYK